MIPFNSAHLPQWASPRLLGQANALPGGRGFNTTPSITLFGASGIQPNVLGTLHWRISTNADLSFNGRQHGAVGMRIARPPSGRPTVYHLKGSVVAGWSGSLPLMYPVVGVSNLSSDLSTAPSQAVFLSAFEVVHHELRIGGGSHLNWDTLITLGENSFHPVDDYDDDTDIWLYGVMVANPGSAAAKIRTLAGCITLARYDRVPLVNVPWVT